MRSKHSEGDNSAATSPSLAAGDEDSRTGRQRGRGQGFRRLSTASTSERGSSGRARLSSQRKHPKLTRHNIDENDEQEFDFGEVAVATSKGTSNPPKSRSSIRLVGNKLQTEAQHFDADSRTSISVSTCVLDDDSDDDDRYNEGSLQGGSTKRGSSDSANTQQAPSQKLAQAKKRLRVTMNSEDGSKDSHNTTEKHAATPSQEVVNTQGGVPKQSLTQNMLQGRWRHSMASLGTFTVCNDVVSLDVGQTMRIITRPDGRLEVAGWVASVERSTVREIVWLKDRHSCSWHRCDQ